MEDNQLALIIFISGVLLAGGGYLYKIKGKFIRPHTKENRKETVVKSTTTVMQEVKTQEPSKITQPVQPQIPVLQNNRPVVHQVLLNEHSEIETRLGMGSGILFGFGFALGVTIFTMVASLFAGSLIAGLVKGIF